MSCSAPALGLRVVASSTRGSGVNNGRRVPAMKLTTRSMATIALASSSRQLKNGNETRDEGIGVAWWVCGGLVVNDVGQDQPLEPMK